MFFRIAVLKNFPIFTGKHRCWSHLLMKLQAFRLLVKFRFLFLVNYGLLVTRPKRSANFSCCLRPISSSQLFGHYMNFGKNLKYWQVFKCQHHLKTLEALQEFIYIFKFVIYAVVLVIIYITNDFV